jgi:hypothetical protein
MIPRAATIVAKPNNVAKKTFDVFSLETAWIPCTRNKNIKDIGSIAKSGYIKGIAIKTDNPRGTAA